MRRVGEKIKSSSGASILFAILVFMLCVLAGTAALTAAAANSGRYAHLKAEQQKYLSVSSAAKLLRDEIAGKGFTVKTVTKTVGEDEKLPEKSVENLPDNEIVSLLKNALESGGSASPVKLTVSGIPNVDEVTAEVTVDPKYNLRIEVYIEGSTKDYLTIVNILATVTDAPAEVEEITDDDGVVTSTRTETKNVTWDPDNATVSWDPKTGSSGGATS